MANNRIAFISLFLFLFQPIPSYSESSNKCLADTKSFTVCEFLAKQGDDEALLTLGYLYEAGLGVEKNTVAAEKIYQNLADKNNKEGFNLLARLKATQGKKEEAIRLYQKAIDLGSSAAPYNLGILYKYNHDYLKAKDAFELAIKKYNSTNAMMSLGDLYLDGLGVNKNITLAEGLYKNAMQEGNDIAITRLAMLYAEIDNYDDAIRLYNIAISKNDPEAMNSMGLLYKYGIGVNLNIKKSVMLFEQASNNNSATGSINLGLMYEEGLGVPQSYEKAIELYEKSYQLGYTDAKLRIDFLKNNILKKSNN
ncbi:SEL1-like repeat protein [Providencia burhodogranariea]|uniref:Sel1 domain-containing protein repeat-containing protein n=1 Tax=Providencia burhodogranariea DSM 19968 TaxID=1141662 RepID=K8WT60_9GAMM|nr:SEL1-like repeat protein [Providencia burhodogranariea]EKT63824.1 Sel1 domain-containing protein repeat-containing protein [Providencia burhodogranariea DSM 19968]